MYIRYYRLIVIILLLNLRIFNKILPQITLALIFSMYYVYISIYLYIGTFYSQLTKNLLSMNKINIIFFNIYKWWKQICINYVWCTSPLHLAIATTLCLNVSALSIFIRSVKLVWRADGTQSNVCHHYTSGTNCAAQISNSHVSNN